MTDCTLHRHFPPEIWTQILHNLPIKSLLSFRTLSKSFLSIISSPNFISSYLHLHPSNIHQTLTLAHTYSYGVYQIRNPSTASSLPAPLNPLLKPRNARILTSSLDGLVLLTSPDAPAFILWNPSSAKTRSVPLPSPLSLSNPVPFDGVKEYDYSSAGSRLAGLAYDFNSMDYKVLYISYNYHIGLVDGDSVRCLGVWVYSVKARSWTAIDGKESGICELRDWSNGPAHSVFFEGAVMWIESWYSESKEYCIRMVRFDVETLRFQYYCELPLPAMQHKKMESRLVILDGGKTLGLFGIDVDDFVSVWSWVAVGGEAGFWVERCVVPECPVPSLVFGSFVQLYKYEELSWRYRAFDGISKIYTYNLRTEDLSEVIPSRCVLYEPDHCAYIQSFVQP